MSQGDVSFANSLITRAYNSGTCELWELEEHHRVRDEGSGRMGGPHKVICWWATPN